VGDGIDAVEMTATPLSDGDEDFLARMARIREAFPRHLAARFATRDVLMSLSASQRQQLARCCESGLDHPDSVVGCYLHHPTDVRDLAAFFVPLLHQHHGTCDRDRHVTAWDLGQDRTPFTVTAAGRPATSVRIRVARNLRGFNLPASMDRAERLALEEHITARLSVLRDHPEHGGRLYSLTPQFRDGVPNPWAVTHAEYQDLAQAHLMFQNMAADRYLTSAGISDDWPYGRACYLSEDRHVIVWIGEEDHLRIICTEATERPDHTFQRLRAVLDLIEAVPDMAPIHDDRFGYVTSCPSNFGTGLRASARLHLPRLTRHPDSLRAACAELGLIPSGRLGDWSAIGRDGIVTVSPIRRLFVSEVDSLACLCEGVRRLTALASTS